MSTETEDEEFLRLARSQWPIAFANVACSIATELGCDAELSSAEQTAVALACAVLLDSAHGNRPWSDVRHMTRLLEDVVERERGLILSFDFDDPTNGFGVTASDFKETKMTRH